MGLLFLLLATSVAASEMFLDSLASGYRWEDDWEYVTQTGVQTGNDELQDYAPGQVRPDEWGSLAGATASGRAVHFGEDPVEAFLAGAGAQRRRL